MFKMTNARSMNEATNSTNELKTICVLPISVGQAYHEGKELDKAVTLINKSFDFCIIVPVDELHRHTAKIENHELSDADAIKLTRNAGNDWEKRTIAEWEKRKTQKKVQGYVPGLTIPYAIIHWERWTSTKAYEERRAYIDDLYKNPEKTVSTSSEDPFHSQVDIVVNTFISGFLNSRQKKSAANKKNLRLFNIKIATELTIEYLLEELAFVEMVSKGLLPPDIDNLPLETEAQPFKFVMAYPFGHNSTNKSVFSCFQEFCSDKLTFLNLSEKPSQKAVLPAIEQKPETPVVTSGRILISKEALSQQIGAIHKGTSETPPACFKSIANLPSSSPSASTVIETTTSEESPDVSSRNLSQGKKSIFKKQPPHATGRNSMTDPEAAYLSPDSSCHIPLLLKRGLSEGSASLFGIKTQSNSQGQPEKNLTFAASHR